MLKNMLDKTQDAETPSSVCLQRSMPGIYWVLLLSYSMEDSHKGIKHV